MEAVRILITGSRTWLDAQQVDDAICEYVQANPAERYVVVHGAAVGADTMAGQAAERLRAAGWPITVEEHPAQWRRLGRRAGFVRNAEMVSAGADVLLAFIHHHSRGAEMTLHLAQRAGLPCQAFRSEA